MMRVDAGEDAGDYGALDFTRYTGGQETLLPTRVSTSPLPVLDRSRPDDSCDSHIESEGLSLPSGLCGDGEEASNADVVAPIMDSSHRPPTSALRLTSTMGKIPPARELHAMAPSEKMAYADMLYEEAAWARIEDPQEQSASSPVTPQNSAASPPHGQRQIVLERRGSVERLPPSKSEVSLPAEPLISASPPSHPPPPSVSPPPPPPQLRRSSVSQPFPSWNRSILTEIYLSHACSCQEVLRAETAGQVSALEWARAHEMLRLWDFVGCGARPPSVEVLTGVWSMRPNSACTHLLQATRPLHTG
jgi:hypothetical protein